MTKEEEIDRLASSDWRNIRDAGRYSLSGDAILRIVCDCAATYLLAFDLDMCPLSTEDNLRRAVDLARRRGLVGR